MPIWFGENNDGGGIAVADINGNDKPDLIVFNIHAVSGANGGHYIIGFDMDSSGVVSDSNWSTNHVLPWFGDSQEGGGLAAADIDGNGRPDLIFFGIDNPAGENHGFYRIGWNVQSDGVVSNWSETISFPGWFGVQNQGGGLAIKDINGNGWPDLIPFSIKHPGNYGYYRIGWDVQAPHHSSWVDGRACSICYDSP